jgi:Uncharacterized protein conserved in bacteria
MKKTLGIISFGAAALTCLSAFGEAQNADASLRAIYTEEWKWRLEQFPGLEGQSKPVPDHLPKGDPATQEMRLHHWEDVVHKLNEIPRAQLSPSEQINYDVFRPEIEDSIADHKFRDFEMPANSDSAFWTNIGYTARRPFKTVTDYKNWIAQMRDVPSYFREEIANMKAGMARNFTPPRATLQGRDKSIATTAEGKPEDSLFYTPFREKMVGVPPADQEKLKAEAAQVIREIVQPAYADLLKFFRDEYLPHTRTTLAAEALPDGKNYYRQKIREFTTLDLSAEEIHQTGLTEVEKLHAQMVDAMHETNFKGEFPAFLEFLRNDPQFYAKTPQELLNRAAWICKVFDGKSSQYFGYLRGCALPSNRCRTTRRLFIRQAAEGLASICLTPTTCRIDRFTILLRSPCMSPRPATLFRGRSRSSTRTSRIFVSTITSQPMAKAGRFIARSSGLRWACMKRLMNASACSATRSGVPAA